MKADYVREQARTNTTFNHHCHWPGCDRNVPPAMWGCKAHWFKLPMRLRSRIWATYRPGQEVTKDPSAEYLAVAHAVQEWIASVDTHPKGGDVKQAPFMGSAVLRQQQTPELSDPRDPDNG